MTATRSRAVWGIALAISLAAACVAATIGLLAAAAPAAASSATAPGERAARRLAPASETLSMVKLVTTNSGDNSIAYNGQTITYTIIITNNSAGNTASAINVLDSLPSGTLDQVSCLSACQTIPLTQSVPEPLGGTIVVTITTGLSWTVALLAPQAATQLVFTARVVGQTDGTVFRNRASALYMLGGNPGVASTPDAATTVRAQIGQSGQPSLANAPTWFSSDLGGTLSQDWGDFNGDGQLDLVLGSSLGVSVYTNQAGVLKPYWNNFSSNRRAYGVRWADFNHNGKLELVAVGDSLSGTAVTSGTNYIYGQAPGGFTQVGSFTSDYQMVRVAVGDFTGDKNIDIVASTNSINAPCPVRLFVNDGSGNFTGPGRCISRVATAALGAVDVDNNGTLDLAVGEFPNTIVVLTNEGGGLFNVTAPITIDNNLPFLPYDFAWGDYNGDGLLDLAAAFPLQKEARIYRNLGNGQFDSPIPPLRTTKFLSPLSVAWGDFNGDGALDLAVADETPKVYLNQNHTFDTSIALAAGAVTGQVWSLRAAQVDHTGDLQLSLTDRDAPSLLFDSFGAHLESSLTPVNASSQPANSVAVGDADGSGTIDMLLGGASLAVQGTEVNYNAGGAFPTQLKLQSGPGPQSVAFGDVNGDGQLDIAVGTAFQAELFTAGQTAPAWTAAAPNGPNHVVAFCDVNSDGKLDLLVGANGSGVAVYLNQGGTLAASPSFVTAETGNIKAIACEDFQHNFYPGFAVAFYDQPAHVYGNNKDGTFTSIWTSGTQSQTTSLAWGDFNGDGFPDLAVGNLDQGTQIYENFSGQLQQQPIWSSPTLSSTTAIAWGDWNNDGSVDLAIGNYGQPTQVFGNLGSTPGQPRMFWLWTSADSPQTTGITWGDFSGDGHLDLALSQNGSCCNGYYHNGSITPSHLASGYVPTTTFTLPNNPSYLYVRRPGTTSDGYANSASEVLGGPSQTTVTVSYSVYDSNGSRGSSNLNAPGDTLANTYYEYSLDGGSHWLTATAAAGWAGPVTTTSRLGQSGTFLWDILKDQAISDDARFRVRIVPFVPAGPVESASAVAVSPPFQVRGVTCIWPENPSMAISQNPISPTVNAWFTGTVLAGSGALTYTWSFGDNSLPAQAQIVQHAFANNGIYTVTLTVSGGPCPQNRDVLVSQQVVVGTGLASQHIYLPLVANGASSAEFDKVSASVAFRHAVPTGSRAPALIGNSTVNTSPSGRPSRPPLFASASHGPPLSAVQVTTSSVGINNEPSLNADGTRMAYWSTANPTGGNPDGNIEVFVMISDTGGLTVTQITSSTGSILGGFNLSPSMDRAGDRVAFFSDRDLTGQNPDQNFEIFLYDVSGRVLTQVTQTSRGFSILPSISADGQYIAFASDRDFVGTNPDGNTEIFRAHILPNGSISFTQVTNSTGGVNDQPHINSDGTRIAFVSDRDLANNGNNNREVFLASIGPSGQVTFTQISNTSAGTTGEPSIDADGQRVAFVSDRSPVPGQFTVTHREIFYADIGASGSLTVTRATTSPVDVGNDQPSISGDGTRIGFISPINNLVRIYDTVLRTELTTTIGAALNPALSSDGTSVAFAFNRQLYMNNYPLAKLTVTKSVPPVSVYPNQLLNYTVVVSNAGPSAATNVALTDTLGSIPGAHPGWQFNGLALNPPAAGACSTVTGTPVTCTISSLAANGLVTLTVGITPTTYGPLSNTAAVSTNTPQRFAAPNVGVTVTVQPVGVVGVNLALSGPTTGTALIGNTFLASVTPITASVPLTYSWQASNLPPVIINSTVLTDSEVFTWNPGGVQVVTVTVTNAAPQVVSATQTITIFNPAPVLGGILPTTANVNSPQTTLVLTGSGFVANSSVLWNGAPLATSFVTSASLTATVPATDLASVGTFNVAVFNTGPGGGLSSALPFLVEYPSPNITTIHPITAAQGGLNFTLALTGSNFVNGANLFFGSQPSLTTFFSNSNSLTATIPFSYLLAAGPVNITVTNPSPSAGPSNARSFTIVSPSLALSVNPSVIDVGQTATLTATISALQAASRTITLTTSDSSVASLPVTITLPAQTASVTVTVQGGTVGTVGGTATLTGTLPASIGGASGTVTLTVSNPTPTISQFSPVTSTAGGPTFTLTLTGTNFVSGASLFWDSQPPVSLAGTGTVVTASIPAAYIATAGPVVLTATNQSPNTGPSLPFIFTVNNPPPSINLISPDPITVTVPVTLDITGGGFVGSTSVQFAGQTLTQTQILSTTELTAAVPVALYPIGGSYIVTVTNPAPGGGSVTGTISAITPAPTLTVLSPVSKTVGNPAFQLTITGTNFVNGATILWSDGVITTPLVPTTFVLPTELAATVPVTAFPTAGIYSVTVLNPAPPVGGVLSTNALTVTVNNPVPSINSINPATAVAGTGGFTLTINGTGNSFLSGATGLWSGSARPTVFVNGNRLNMTVQDADLDTVGTFTVTVKNPDPTPGTSASRNFIVTAPTVSLTPSTAQTITLPTDGVLTATISNAQVASTVISLTSSNPAVVSVPTTTTLPAGPGGISFTLSTSISGTAVITAQLPSSLGGGVSNLVTINVKDAAITGLTASNDSPTALGSATQLTATITTGTNVSYTWKLGDGSAPTPLTTTNVITNLYPIGAGSIYTAVVTATNSIGTKVVATTVVTINNPVPDISGMSPITLSVGASTAITLTGSNFITGAKVQIQLHSGGPITTYTPSSVSATQILVTILGSDIGLASSYDVWVLNLDPPAADISNKFPFTVQ